MAALYRADDNALILIEDGKAYVQPLPEGKRTLCAYLPSNGLHRLGLIGSDHMYMVDPWHGLAIRELNTDAVKSGVLTVMNPPDEVQQNAFLREHPEILVTNTDDAAYSQEALLNALQTGTLEADLVSSSDLPINRLARKGYIAEITDPELLAVAKQMDPRLLAPCLVDGRLYAMPMSVCASNYQYNKALAEDMGFTADTLPKTFFELLDIIKAWPETYGETFPEATPFWDASLRDSLYHTMLETYCAYWERSHQRLSFNTPLFRALLSALGDIDFDYLAKELQFDDDAFWDKEPLFNAMNAFALNAIDDPDAFLPLALTAGAEPITAVSLKAMVINARSTRQAEALAYLRCVTAHYPSAGENVFFFPEHNGEVIRPGHDEEIARQKEYIDQLKTLADAPDTPDPAEIRQRIADMTGWLNDMADDRILLSAESIRFYRENIAPTLYCPSALSSQIGGDDVLRRFADKAIGAEQVIDELENRVRLMFGEDGL